MKKHQVSENTLELEIINDLKEVSVVIAEFESFCLKHNVENTAVQKMNVVLDEIINNIINYGYPQEEERLISVKITIENSSMTLIITDDGVAFNPFSIDKPDLSLSLEDRPIGGVGLHIVKNLMDSYAYERVSDRNIVEIVKDNINQL
jgi:anti-sigma regulatory factor (Ser/Thr protein kinase)